jgi:cytochrome c peroxidase
MSATSNAQSVRAAGWRRFGRMGALLCSLWLLGCGSGTRPELDREQREAPELAGDAPIEPLPLREDFDTQRAALGEALFKEPLLSGDGKVACSNCHSADHGLAEDKQRSFAPGRPESLVNSPTLYNIRYMYKLAWAGKFDSLEAHLDALIQNPAVMASSWESSARRLGEQPEYKERFSRVFADGLKPANVRAALIEYERSLVTPNAPFDRFLRGEINAISNDAKRGYALFKGYGCISCHQGAAVGANLVQRFGVMRDYFADRGHVAPGDLGRYNVTRREEDRFVFRVPSLRNVALTAPYFHDGSAKTLEDAITVMGRYQLGRELAPDDVALLSAFLRSLTGEYRGKPP